MGRGGKRLEEVTGLQGGRCGPLLVERTVCWFMRAARFLLSSGLPPLHKMRDWRTRVEVLSRLNRKMPIPERNE